MIRLKIAPARWNLRSAIKDLDPGCFGLVMATGIVSRAMVLDGAVRLAGILLGIAIAAYLVLAVGLVWRLAGFTREMRADARDPRRAFGFFTVPAASNVLAARLAGDGHLLAAAVLIGIGATTWVILSYGILPLMVGQETARAERAGERVFRPTLTEANGTWFLWPVAAQSVAVGLTSLAPPVPVALTAFAVACWAVGAVLYFLVAAVVTVALLVVPVRAADLTPAYWVFMGAAAISVLAGAQLLRLPSGLLEAAMHALLAGSCVLLWAFGSWLIPLLVVLGVWRHLLRRVPLAFEPAWWSIAFPVGMYGVASHELGTVLKLPWLVALGRREAWVALAVWGIVALAMIPAAAGRRNRR